MGFIWCSARRWACFLSDPTNVCLGSAEVLIGLVLAHGTTELLKRALLLLVPTIFCRSHHLINFAWVHPFRYLPSFLNLHACLSNLETLGDGVMQLLWRASGLLVRLLLSFGSLVSFRPDAFVPIYSRHSWIFVSYVRRSWKTWAFSRMRGRCSSGGNGQCPGLKCTGRCWEWANITVALFNSPLPILLLLFLSSLLPSSSTREAATDVRN